MNNQTLVIYDFKVLYEILSEIESYINFNLINIDQITELKSKTLNNYLIISNKNKKDANDLIVLREFPVYMAKFIETINIKFLKKKYNQQSEINLGLYKLNFNSRKIFNEEKSLALTERETNIIIFLNSSKKPVNITQLQTEVWGHNSKLETHTVETHIYRLRKKIKNIFDDNNFIKSSKSGYIIK